MNRAEVFDLLIAIKENYPHFDVSDENVERHLKYLIDIPFSAAKTNLDEHIRTGKWPPNIAELRGNVGDQAARQRELDETRWYLKQQCENRKRATLPPAGWRESIIARLTHSGH